MEEYEKTGRLAAESGVVKMKPKFWHSRKFWLFVMYGAAILLVILLWIFGAGCSPSKLVLAKKYVDTLSSDAQQELYEHLSILLGIKDSFWGVYSQWFYYSKEIIGWIIGAAIAIMLATLYLTKKYKIDNKFLISIGVFIGLTLIMMSGRFIEKFFTGHTVYIGEIILSNFFGLIVSNLLYNMGKSAVKIKQKFTL